MSNAGAMAALVPDQELVAYGGHRYSTPVMADEPSSHVLHPFWDRSIRFLLQRPAHLAAIVRLARPELADRLDFEHLERIDRSFVLDDYRQREADLIVRATYRAEQEEREVLVYLLVEHQSTVDAWMPFRLLFYMTQLWEDQRRRVGPESESNGLAPIIPVIFYTGDRPWKAGQYMEGLIEGAPELLPFCPRFDILFVGLREASPAALESIGPLGWALRAVQRVEASRPEFAEVLKRAAEATDAVFGDEWRELISFLLLLVAHRRPSHEFAEWRGVLEQALTDRGRQEEFEMVEKSYAQVTFERGEAQGERKGQLAALQRVILRLGRRRFGEPTPEQQARLEAIDSPDRLERLSDEIMDAASWDDLLGRA